MRISVKAQRRKRTEKEKNINNLPGQPGQIWKRVGTVAESTVKSRVLNRHVLVDLWRSPPTEATDGVIRAADSGYLI